MTQLSTTVLSKDFINLTTNKTSIQVVSNVGIALYNTCKFKSQIFSRPEDTNFVFEKPRLIQF